MLCRFVLLSCLVQAAFSLNLRDPQLESAVVNTNEVKSPNAVGFAEDTLSEDDESPKLSTQHQETLGEHSSDDEVFAKLAAKVDEDAVSEDDPVDDVDAEEGGGSASKMRTRPNMGKGPDTIEFAMFGKTFYGDNLKSSSFTIDIVMTLKWMDKRVAAMIPEGLDTLTLSKKESERKLWLPGMVITNRDIGKYDLISTAVFIKKSGEVFKVERATAIVKNEFFLEDFPFDRQKLIVKIASHKYMMKDVVLKPMEGTGIKKGLFEGTGWNFADVGSSEYKDVDGALKKSRGLLTITVDRELDKYKQGHLIPAFIITMISFGVFWFPFVAPFITPRLAMSILSLLTFTNLSIKSSSALPSGAPFNWNDIINRSIMSSMFCTVCLNIMTEICFHQLKVDNLARSINHECKVLIPLFTTISLTLTLSAAGRNGWMSLGTTSTVEMIVFCSLWCCYLAYTGNRIRAELAAKKAEAAKKAAEEGKI